MPTISGVASESFRTRRQKKPMKSWTQWQREVVALLRGDFDEVSPHISLDDVDWQSWRGFFDQGRSPRAAIELALERDL